MSEEPTDLQLIEHSCRRILAYSSMLNSIEQSSLAEELGDVLVQYDFYAF